MSSIGYARVSTADQDTAARQLLATGAKPDRPAALTSEQVDAARQLLATGTSAASLTRTLGVGRSTLYRHLGTNPG